MAMKSAAVVAASFWLAASSLLEAAPLSRTTRMVASDMVQSRAPTLRTGGSGIVKQFWFAHGGTVRLSWEYRVVTGNFVILIVDGAVHECDTMTSSMTFVEGTCDIHVSAGGSIALRIFGSAGGTGAVRQVEVSYDLVEATRASIVVEN